MTKRVKMCKYSGLDSVCPRDSEGILKCPKRANLACQIIAPKKSKTVKVKCWITNRINKEHPNQMVTMDPTAGKDGWLPITITQREVK